MEYQTPSSNLPILKYGREMEERARENYYALSWSLSFEFCDHENCSRHQYQLLSPGCLPRWNYRL